MEIKIASIQKGTPAQEFLPLITDAHNLRYSHAEKNCLYFQIFRFPYKEMTKAVASHEDGTVKFMKSYIRAAVKRQETVLQFVFRYQVEKVERRKSGELKRRSIIEKERVFLISFSVISVNPAAPDLLTARKTEKRAGAVALARRPAVR